MYNELKVSLERHYFVLYDSALTLKMKKWRLIRFAMKLLVPTENLVVYRVSKIPVK